MAIFELLFNALAIFYAFRAVQLLRQLWAERATLRQPPLTGAQKQSAEGVAFYVAIPPGVFLHELAHAVTVLAFGGEIMRFRVYGYWGFVEHVGTYTDFQRWFIALAGTLGSLLYCAALWAWAARQKAPFYRYAGLRSMRFNVYFALVYYPLFTLATQFGDWRTIYDFGLVPLPAAATLLVHALLLGAFYWLDRRGAFAMPDFQTAAQATRFAALRERADAQPNDTALQLAYATELVNHGLAGQAQPLLQRAVAQQPQSADIHMLLGRAALAGGRQSKSAAATHFAKALEIGLPDAAQRIMVRRLLAEVAFDKGKAAEALAQLDRCIDDVRTAPGLSPAVARMCYQTRGIIRRQTGRYAEADADLQQALQLAREEATPGAVAGVERELSVLANHRQRG